MSVITDRVQKVIEVLEDQLARREKVRKYSLLPDFQESIKKNSYSQIATSAASLRDIEREIKAVNAMIRKLETALQNHNDDHDLEMAVLKMLFEGIHKRPGSEDVKDSFESSMASMFGMYFNYNGNLVEE